MTETAGGVTLRGSVTLPAPPADVVPWLVEPEAMDRWMTGIDGIEVLGDDAGIRVHASMGGHAGWIFRGRVAERSATRVVREYALEELSARGAVLAADTAGYARTVTYDLAPDGDGTALTCTVTTVIPGVVPSPGDAATRREQKTLDRSLDRLEAQVAGRGVGLLGRLRGAGGVPCPL